MLLDTKTLQIYFHPAKCLLLTLAMMKRVPPEPSEGIQRIAQKWCAEPLFFHILSEAFPHIPSKCCFSVVSGQVTRSGRIILPPKMLAVLPLKQFLGINMTFRISQSRQNLQNVC